LSSFGLAALFDPAALDAVRTAVRRDFTSAAVREVLGLAGEGALSRHDLSGADRLTRGGSPTETLIRLFVLGLSVPESEAEAALRPLAPLDAVRAGLLEPRGERLRAALDLRPYSEQDGPDWWVVSDLGADVRPGVLHSEHVLGIGSAALTLAQATVRRPAARALDLGTGCGVQALHLSRHCRSVTATDLSERALAMAATTAALNDLEWDLRLGSLVEPVAGERFDLVVCNPPFIVGPGFVPGAGGFTYRDSGRAGDEVCRELISSLPALLEPGGTAQLLANWTITGDEPWSERVGGWLASSGCSAWVWQREVAEPGEYAALWLDDAGEQPGTAGWRTGYDRWLDWFAGAGVAAVGMGLVSIRRPIGGEPGGVGQAAGGRQGAPAVICEDVPQPVVQPIGAEIAAWFDRQAWLRDGGEQAVPDARQFGDRLLDARLRAAPGLVLEVRSLLGESGWEPRLTQLRQSGGMRWEIEVDDLVAGVLGACSGTTQLRIVLDLIAATVPAPVGDVRRALLPVVADLVQRGFLIPPDGA
jgi:methylase of polypeptide subunit release factors